MLRYFYDHHLIRYDHNPIHDWKDAIRRSCVPLEREGYVTAQYAEDIIDCVNTYGPYIVIVPQVAMPHAEEESDGVIGTAISMTHFDEPVTFYDKDTHEDKQAQLFFTLAAKEPTAHLEHMSNLMELLMQDGMIDALVRTQSIEDYERLMQQAEG